MLFKLFPAKKMGIGKKFKDLSNLVKKTLVRLFLHPPTPATIWLLSAAPNSIEGNPTPGFTCSF